MTLFSMASMSDVIFLLLIFFMVTSTFVFPNALEVNLPQSSQQTALKPGTRVYIDKELNMYAAQGDAEPERIAEADLIGFLQIAQQQSPDQFIALYADENVTAARIVGVYISVAGASFKMVLATKPSNKH